MEIVADPSAPKKKDEDLSSILLLIWKRKENEMVNVWAMIENLNSADAPKISEFGGIPQDLPVERLVNPQCVLVGSHLYCIGGAMVDWKFGGERDSTSNKVFQFDINQPSKGWKVCHYLPFFGPNIQVAVSGDLVYIFPQGDSFYNSAIDTENWAYILDTKDASLSRFLNRPEPYCLRVAVCASMDDVAVVGRGVMVYLSNGDVWFHDPLDRDCPWKTYNDLFRNNSPEPVPRNIDASTVSNGILYILQVVYHASSVELATKPMLSAYDIAQGKLLFGDASLKGPDLLSGSTFVNYLFPIGDCKLCWLELIPGLGLAYTIISVCYDATPPLHVDKAGILENSEFKFLPTCLPIDSFCWDRIKRQEESFKGSSFPGHPFVGCVEEFRPLSKYTGNRDSPKTPILMLIWGMERNNLESAWVMIVNLDSSTDRTQIIKCSQSLLDLPEESNKLLDPSPPHSLLVGSHLYSIHSVMEDSSNKVLRYDIPSGCWNDFYCLPFSSKNIMTAVSGDFIYIFPPPGMSSLHPPSISPIEWAYIIDTKEHKGRYIPFPSPNECLAFQLLLVRVLLMLLLVGFWSTFIKIIRM